MVEGKEKCVKKYKMIETIRPQEIPLEFIKRKVARGKKKAELV